MNHFLRLVLCVLAFASLAACEVAPQKVDIPKPAVQEKQTVNIDPTLLQDCPGVSPVAVDHDLDQQESLEIIQQLAGALSVCWHRHHDLSSVAQSAFNITAPATPASSSAISK